MGKQRTIYPFRDYAAFEDGSVIAVLPDGEGLIRIKPNGEPDLAFGQNGLVELPGNRKVAYPFIERLDASRVVVQAGPAYDPATDQSVPAIAVYTSTGALDASFAAGGIYTGNVGLIHAAPGEPFTCSTGIHSEQTRRVSRGV